jgi:two-component system chemotaxis sensor kinase CheA
MRQWDGHDIETVRRELHTVKGGAMQFGASSLAKIIYDAELEILGCQPRERHDLIRRLGREVQDRVAVWQKEKMPLFTQLGVYDSAKVEISRRKIEALEKKWATLSHGNQAVRGLLDELLSTELGDLLRDFESHTKATALKLGKPVLFHVEEPAAPISVPPNFHHEVMRNLVHLFNNAVDHGLESPQTRRALGKPEEGKITVRYEPVKIDGGNWIRFSIEDDGGGINVAKLRAKLAAKGDSGAAQAPDLDVAMRIFDGALSTKETVTELSGQGVGMGSVSAAVATAGGRIRILRTGPLGTQFEILLPWASEQKNPAPKAA